MGNYRSYRVIHSVGRQWGKFLNYHLSNLWLDDWSLKASRCRGCCVNGVPQVFDMLPHVVSLAGYYQKAWMKGSGIQFAWVLPSLTAVTAAKPGASESHGLPLWLLSWLPSGAATASSASGGPYSEQGPAVLSIKRWVWTPFCAASSSEDSSSVTSSLQFYPVSVTLWLHLSLAQAWCHVVNRKCGLHPATLLTGSISSTGLSLLMPRKLQ